MIELSAPFNWCDRKCQRCPLRAGCAVANDTRSMDEALGDAVEMLEELVGDAPEPPPPPPPSAEEQTLQDAAYEWAMFVEGALRDGRGMLIAGKVARIVSENAFDDADLHEADTVPNLLLVERVLDDVARDLARRAPHERERFAARDQRLRGMLAPHFATITPVDRAALAVLERAGRAPSPFL